jgi:beta-N-acetylhexosaminidase
VEALNAGVDLILISYDWSQYFPVMHGLLRAERHGRLQQAALAKSDARLWLTRPGNR